jgi:upstream activation factor subunit UAF30
MESAQNSKAKKVVSKKKEATKKETPAAPPAPAPTPVEIAAETSEENVTATVEENESNILQQFSTFFVKLQRVQSDFSSLKSDFKSLEKRCLREFKAVQKTTKKKRNANANGGGFKKPVPISNELAAFLNKPEGTVMARTDVTSAITQYFKENNLQDPANGRNLIPNAALTKLFKLEPTDHLSYFNLQKFLKPHFPKVEAAAPVATA